jgi:hypothetical protein
MNLVPLLYVGFRIFPFILVCFFALSSIIKSDVRGIIFLGILLINCVMVLFFTAVLPEMIKPSPSDDYKAICNALSIGNNGERLSSIPFNINIVSFVFGYLVYLIAKNKQVDANIHSIIFFTVLLFIIIVWEFANGCSNIVGIVSAIVIGAGTGIGICELFDFMAKKYKIRGLHFFTSVTNDTEVCKMTNEDLFECSATT